MTSKSGASLLYSAWHNSWAKKHGKTTYKYGIKYQIG